MKMKPSHPGEILSEDILKPMGLSITEAARALGISRKTLSGVINGRYNLTPDLAARVALATNTSVEFWINLQAQHDAWEMQQKEKIPKGVATFDSVCHA